MAFNPYFRCGTTSLDLSGISGMSFPEPVGEQQHTCLTEKNKYSITTRKHGTTAIGMQTQGIQKTARGTIWDFWNTTLAKGYNDMTVIDHRGRMLFDVSWGEWREQWRKERGGLYNIDYDLQSPLTWTPACWGLFPTTTNSLVNHNLSGNDVTLSNATLVNYATDNNILRRNGYALKLDGAVGSTGAYNSTAFNWRTKYQYNSLSMFCQARCANLYLDIDLMRITDAQGAYNNGFVLRFEKVDSSTLALVGLIKNGGNITEITRSDTTHPGLAVDTWYDLAITYENVTGRLRVYWALSGTSTTFTDFLYGQTSIENGILSTASAAYRPPDIQWKYLYLLAGTVAYGNHYLQNAMVFDGFLSAQEFNTLRRLCWMWNGKTSGSHPA